jgi:hypothetical protein
MSRTDSSQTHAISVEPTGVFNNPTPPANEIGAVIIEFILVIPILLTILGYSLRLTQILQANQIAMVISREAATEAFRLCTDLTIQLPSCDASANVCVDTVKTKAATEYCLGKIKEKYEALWPIAKPSASSSDSAPTIDVEVYRYDLGSFVTLNNCIGDESKVSRFTTITSSQPYQISAAALCVRNRVSRAKISFKIKPTSAFLNLSGGVADSDLTVVDETML